MDWVIRPEEPGDAPSIFSLTQRAFAPMNYSSGTEPKIIDALRNSGDLSLSLVAEHGGTIVGQITFSPVTINQDHDDWFGLGPVSVEPKQQGKGMGSALIIEGLRLLKSRAAKGCVLVGNPDYYNRFGFISDPGLKYGELDTRYIQQIVFGGPVRTGSLKYCEAFEAAAG